MSAAARDTLASIASAMPDGDISSKLPDMWNLYEGYFASMRDAPLRILELGIHRGVSARTLATYFRNGIVVAVDIDVPAPDTAALANLWLEPCDQRSAEGLAQITERFAPTGWDVIIDDASHVGEWSLESFNLLFPRLKSGGLYFVEDWCVAYVDPTRWGDASEPEPPRPHDPHGGINRRIASHDYGMAGFVKSLLDRAYFPKSIFEWLHVHDFLVAARKRVTPPRRSKPPRQGT